MLQVYHLVYLFVCLELRPYDSKFTPPRNSHVTSVAATAKLYRPCSSNAINVSAAYVSSPRSFSSPISAVIAHNVNSNACSSGGNNNGYYASGSLRVAVTPDGQYLYACNPVDGSSGQIVIIKIIDNSIISRISVGSNPVGIAITSDGKYVCLSHADDNFISIIDMSKETVVVTTISGFNFPSGIAVTPDSRYAYVANTLDNVIVVIDIATGTVKIPSISVGANPYGIAITPDGKYAYVTNLSGNSVSVIHIATNSVVGMPIPVGNTPAGIAITPDGKYAYVVNGTSNSVSVIDIATNIVVDTIPVGNAPVGIAITPDGKYAYVMNKTSSSISVIDILTNSVTDSISYSLNEAPGIIATTNSEFVYATGSDSSHTINEISTTTNAVVDTIVL